MLDYTQRKLIRALVRHDRSLDPPKSKITIIDGVELRHSVRILDRSKTAPPSVAGPRGQRHRVRLS
jgi:hypothetical protein